MNQATTERRPGRSGARAVPAAPSALGGTPPASARPTALRPAAADTDADVVPDLVPDLDATGGRGPAVAGVVAFGAVAVLAVLVCAALVGGAATPSLLSDPGPVTRWGVLVARTVSDLASIGTLGVLLVAVVLLPRVDTGFGPDGARLVRSVAWWSGVWSAASLATMLLTLSEAAGLPVLGVLRPDVLALALELETTRALLSAAWLALLVAIGARVSRTPATGTLLLLGAVAAIVLPLLTGHAGHGEAPALTATSLSIHVVAAAGWVGGLAALLVHLRRSPLALAVALPRFSSLALVCFVAVGFSGAVTAWASFATVDQLWTTPYGRLLLAKVAALVVLGAFGHRHRLRTVDAAVARRPRAFVRLAAGEVVLMACAAALAVALSHTAPPTQPDHTGTVAVQADGELRTPVPAAVLR